MAPPPVSNALQPGCAGDSFSLLFSSSAMPPPSRSTLPTSSEPRLPPDSTPGSTEQVSGDEMTGAAGLEEFEGTVSFTNLDKVLYPSTGFTKGDLIRYFVAVAPYAIPHLTGRALTLRRYPNGVDQKSFFEKRCPSHAPGFVNIVSWKPSSKDDPINACSVDSTETMAWLVNTAAVGLR